eukprot:CAMPEP_0114690204 /NCGR_PEP_ID=MMETSP0191-20121206/65429_1 /TAXON_ID=126664 /ORGANISM="Sorites sp." /LENGTH=347 /DNA_ID=CAMNT_0001979823 /DNA_START=12 /DNA_END=1056 /DNA_ORIENTATION=+
MVNEEVDVLLQRVADVVEKHDNRNTIETLQDIGRRIRSLLAKVVPKMLHARDNSSAMEIDTRPSKRSQATYAQQVLLAMEIDTRPSQRSQATYAQQVLLKLQTFSAWAWPVIIEYTRDAYDDEQITPQIQARMEQGTDGSLGYLSSVLVYAWEAAEYQFPVVEGLMQRNETSGETLMKAGCAASYAQLLGDITEMYGELSGSKMMCFMNTTNKTVWKSCASDASQSLYKVTSAIAQASNAMWQCFGLFWGCAQLTNTAYSQMVKALIASEEMSNDCNEEKFPICKPLAFKAMGALSQAAGQMATASDECALKGDGGESPLNPYAATPFEKREDAPNATAAPAPPPLP